MPLTDELGEACLLSDVVPRDDPRVPKRFTNGSFEIWLSELAADQPYLPVYDNRANEALFLRFSQAIADVLGGRMQDVLAEKWPEWLPAFLKVAHVTETTVVTFNYDTLLECAAETGVVYDPAVGEITWPEMIDLVPPWAGNRLELRAEPPATMSLLKVHGSLNWYWAPGDASGVSVARWLLPGRYGNPHPDVDRERRRELPGRVPLVVPPTSTKGTYYTNSIVRELWTKAARAVRDADRVVLMGYSLPLTDFTFNAMLRHGLDAERASVVVADRRPQAVASRAGTFGCPVDVVAPDTPSGPIAAHVQAWCRRVAIGVADTVRARAVGEPEAPMVVAWGPQAAAAVTAVSSDGSDVVLSVEQVREATWVKARGIDTALPTWGDVLALLDRVPGALVVAAPNDPQPVLQCSLTHTTTGYGGGAWNVLMPAGAAPSPKGLGTPPSPARERSHKRFSME